MDEELREAIGIAIGQASMCWSELPSGVFDSTRAKDIADELFMKVKDTFHKYKHYDNNVCTK